MQNGWIKLHKSLLDWEWYQDINTHRLFIHLLLIANYKESKWRGQTIKPGQILTGRKKLSEQTGLSERAVRTALTHLKSTNEVTIKTTKLYSIITLNKWEEYQQEATNETPTKSSANRPTTDQQPTTSKNIRSKEIKKRRISRLILTKNQKEKLKLQFPQADITLELKKANDWLVAEGVEKKDYLAWFRNWLRRQSRERSDEAIKRVKEDSKLPEDNFSEEDREKARQRIAQIKNQFQVKSL